MTNDLSIRNMVKCFGDFTAVDDVTFDVPTGSFFSILGPSGCGKTTLLRMIAGFEEPTSGVLEIRGRDMLGVPPNRRPVNLVFQHLALFPMMNVAENIAFGLKRRGVGSAEIRKKTQQILERVGLPGFGEKGINQLSGGQKQRVAIARCLVLEPSVLLLDEPLGALDLKLRDQMKVELKKLQAKVGTTFIYITHDQSEALVMSDRVAVMNNGRFEQIGTPQELYGQPKTPFVAQFVGDNNRWSGRITESIGDEVMLSTDEGYTFRTRIHASCRSGARVNLFLRPEAMRIEPRDRDGLNIFGVTVKGILFDGANSRLLTVTKEEHELIVTLPQNRKFDHIVAGDKITVGWHPEAGICFGAEG
ncbi:ABC transporter ATP-binding protein [Pseudodesulfovibrio piezophilus]|uniref:Spermidine/putrescine import ATP-binding protein PotA n=1 Tax=Pseudodesulfovibrio piezophilus (strain DSM 21447 / JCM 15486 / C1TLV30) TaxID=1322246 RepID=M1WSP4_PSEP2|nr:ABC transporter ATP-binding protein [Pseudodesulfovibrio piezophilus]CCH50309.1 Spermidine/putrescine import ATP-binding protein PotA [Pseudodesulfovibrio piezophilus C1TLV30]